MVVVKEYRIPVPLTLEEFQRGRAYIFAVESKSKCSTVTTEPFSDKSFLDGRFTSGQFAHRIFDIRNDVPRFAKRFVPSSITQLHEHCWNSFPYCYSEYFTPDYDADKEKFHVVVQTLCIEDNTGFLKNVFGLDRNMLKLRGVKDINIADDSNNVRFT